MFEPHTSASESREIYKINNILRFYRVNFYYSLRKDCIFLFEGRSVKSRIISAYILSALGGIILALTFFMPALTELFLIKITAYLVGTLSILSGIYILRDFYLKIKYNKSKTMITRSGISFREGNQFEFWSHKNIKNMEVVNTISQKKSLKAGFNEEKLEKITKVIIYNNLGIAKTLLEISNKNRQITKSDLEEMTDFIIRFCSSEKSDTKKAPENSRAVVLNN